MNLKLANKKFKSKTIYKIEYFDEQGGFVISFTDFTKLSIKSNNNKESKLEVSESIKNKLINIKKLDIL